MLLGGEIALGRQGYVTCVAGFFYLCARWRDSSGGHSETLTAFDKGQATAFLQERLRDRKFSLQPGSSPPSRVCAQVHSRDLCFTKFKKPCQVVRQITMT